jgi:hypothetical protein
MLMAAMLFAGMAAPALAGTDDISWFVQQNAVESNGLFNAGASGAAMDGENVLVTLALADPLNEGLALHMIVYAVLEWEEDKIYSDLFAYGSGLAVEIVYDGERLFYTEGASVTHPGGEMDAATVQWLRAQLLGGE